MHGHRIFVAVPGRRRERSIDDPHEIPRDVRPEIAQRFPIVPLVRIAQVRERHRDHRVTGGDHPIEHDAERVNVALDGCGASVQHLGREIDGRPGRHRTIRGRQASNLARAKIHEHHAAAVLADDVTRLHIAVHEPRGVDGGKRLTQFLADERGFRDGEPLARLQRVLERASGNELHPESDTTLVDIGAMDRDDVGMADPGQRARFVEDTEKRGLLAGHGFEQLEGDLAIEPRIAGAIDLAVRTLTDLLDQQEVAPSLAALRCPGKIRDDGRWFVHLAAVHFGKPRDQAELLQKAPLAFVERRRVYAVPVDRRPIGY